MPTNEQYHNLVSKAGPIGHISNKRELAMFLANVLHESAGLTATEEWGPPPAGTYSFPQLDRPGRRYHGRGYIQLTWYVRIYALLSSREDVVTVCHITLTDFLTR